MIPPVLRPRSRIDSLLLGGTLAVTALVLALAASFLDTHRRDLVELARTQSRNLALSLDLSLSSTLKGVDLALGTVAGEMERELAGGGLELTRMKRFLTAEERLLPETLGLWVADDQGRAILGPGTDDQTTSYADRAYFRQLRDQPAAGMVSSKPLYGHITRTWLIMCARRYNGPDGRFAGTVMMPVSIAYLHAQVTGFDLGPGGTLVIRALDGELITREPQPGGGGPPPSWQVSAALMEFLRSGDAQRTYFARNPTDGVRRTYTARKLPGSPLVVLAGLAEDAYLEPWRRDRRHTIVLVGAFLVGLWLTAGMLAVALRARERDALALMASEAKNRQLEKNESLGRMAGSIAHHFNNKLQSVQGCLDLLGQQSLDSKTGRHLAAAQRATEEAAEVSRLLLIYLGQTHGALATVSMAEVCRDTLASLGSSVELEAAGPAHGPDIHANLDKFRQILIRLVANAREALPETTGTVRVRTAVCARRDIPSAHRHPLGWEARDAVYACLAVGDSGCGIAAEDLDKVFDPFYSTKFPGRGLGLPVVLGLVQALGGAITVESEEGRGSLFRVFLPLAVEGPAGSEEAAGPGKGPRMAP